MRSGTLALAVLLSSIATFAQSAKVVVLGTIGQAAAFADEYTTHKILTAHVVGIEPGGIVIVQPPTGVEGDPLARPFVHLPFPAQAASGAAMVYGVTYIGIRLRRKHSRWWWVPQAVQIATNTFFAVHNAHYIR